MGSRQIRRQFHLFIALLVWRDDRKWEFNSELTERPSKKLNCDLNDPFSFKYISN